MPSAKKVRIGTALEHDAAWVHFASPYLLGPLREDLPGLARRLRADGTGVSLDTNWDPSERWDTVAELVPEVDVLLPNRSELEAIARALSVSHVHPAEAISRLGPRVVVKDGARGGFSVSMAGPRIHAPGLAVDVVDTTGAGDSFDAGYIAAIAHDVTDEHERLR
ncbi:MAG: PfkB family carbohydrate kinase [Microbacterium sp.]|uniref:carbohydrate kinase family protein n=1 Tax=Microbacterium sp. TaxID=51671 RepID=UPI0039E28435